ncbi:malonate decarboxylase holo-ACP synthase [Pseudomonas indica]|uniref:malonate decarboxylase holo-ACP synthase n=1 Tax=Pseudomonas indica TaxID=137658 RepID=UPI0023F8822B|nr:malonate decarboxylase holo-ACP synthase [Pseudomonas indica]MBU3058756.1 malonate decarboxylase holo-ACP synthase [Pseudomonas indica]
MAFIDRAMLRPHDLVWGLTPNQLPADAPAWVGEALGERPPVVIRRAPAEPGWLPVGVRGRGREQRYATWLRLDRLTRKVSPEALARARRWRRHAQSQWPVLRALGLLQARLDGCGLCWGPTGSAGFELASGLPVLHPTSDLDLLLRTPAPLGREQARQLLMLLEDMPCTVDVQLETPNGGVALREWASGAARVLLKGREGPALVADPWRLAQ